MYYCTISEVITIGAELVNKTTCDICGRYLVCNWITSNDVYNFHERDEEWEYAMVCDDCLLVLEL